MLKFEVDDLISSYVKQYIFEYGMEKMETIVKKIDESEKVNAFIDQLIAVKKIPDSNTILSFLNTIGYFIFSKSETLCLGAIKLEIKWTNTVFDTATESLSMSKKMDFAIKYEKWRTKLVVDIIIKCSASKLTTGRNFFDRYFYELASMYKSVSPKIEIEDNDLDYHFK